MAQILSNENRQLLKIILDKKPASLTELESSGEISKEESLRRPKPIDETIASMEMATLQDTIASIESSSQPALKPKN